MFPQTTYSAYLVDSTGKNEPLGISRTAIESTNQGKVWEMGVNAFNAYKDNGKWDKLVMFRCEPVVAREAFL